jgi:DNA modification methylase
MQISVLGTPYEELNYKIINDDCLNALKDIPDNSIDSVVTDPPYELGFMNKGWDSTGIAYNIEMWKEVLRVLKPGGHMLAFGGTRTYHRMACAIEDAGFEIRDQLQWLNGSGFPKSLNISKAIDKAAGVERKVVGKTKSKGIRPGQGNYIGDHYQCDGYDVTIPSTPDAIKWDGWGTALKPANEPICLARKPLSEKTVAANVLKWGTGGINIDKCRVGNETMYNQYCKPKQGYMSDKYRASGGVFSKSGCNVANGRFPANILLDETAAAMLDEQSGENSGGASRFFYVAKASARERGAGNNHPTVKPIRLMRYLCRLITPPGGTVLDPFAGSGTTLLAGLMENFRAIGIEKEREYCDIIHKRINEYKERNSGSDEFPMLWDDWPSHLEPPTEEDIAFLAELNNRE